MVRNEKGQFVAEDTRTTDEKLEAVRAELAKLEQQKANEEAEAKRAASLARKEEAEIVNIAIDKYEEAKNICNEKIKAAYEEYRAKVNEAEKELKLVENEADEKLNKFLETHDSFHYTYRSKDGNVVRNYDYRTKAYNAFDNYKEFVNAVNRLWHNM